MRYFWRLGSPGRRPTHLLRPARAAASRQEAAGIATSDGQNIKCIKGKGLITEVFNTETINKMDGIHAIGHVRYSTDGGNEIENVQPIMVRAHTGHFGAVHNGQIVNASELKEELEESGQHFPGQQRQRDHAAPDPAGSGNVRREDHGRLP